MPIKPPLKQNSIVPVVTFAAVEEALPCVDALLEGGIGQIEITLRSSVALDCISTVAKSRPEIKVAAGTVLTRQQLVAAKSAGASFAFSPGFDENLCQVAEELAFPYLPAVSTISELMAAWRMGYSLVKVFPAKVLGGLDLLRAWHGPMPEMCFCPTGGVGEADVAEYFSFAPVLAVGGSWLVTKSDLENKAWKLIAKKSAASVAAVSDL